MRADNPETAPGATQPNPAALHSGGHLQRGTGGDHLLSSDKLPDSGRTSAPQLLRVNCHDSGNSPASRLLGYAIRTCPEKVKAASPLAYIGPSDPPIMIPHGHLDRLAPHDPGEQFYIVFNKVYKETIFIGLSKLRMET